MAFSFPRALWAKWFAGLFRSLEPTKVSDLADLNHEVWTEIAPELKPSDFQYPQKMSVEALRRLSRIRRASGVPMRVVGDWRPRDADFGASKSAHMEEPCTAVDLRVTNNEERHKLVEAALAEGCPRIGIYSPTDWQSSTYGKGSGSVHLDFSPHNPAPRMWLRY